MRDRPGLPPSRWVHDWWMIPLFKMFSLFTVDERHCSMLIVRDRELRKSALGIATLASNEKFRSKRILWKKEIQSFHSEKSAIFAAVVWGESDFIDSLSLLQWRLTWSSGLSMCSRFLSYMILRIGRPKIRLYFHSRGRKFSDFI